MAVLKRLFGVAPHEVQDPPSPAVPGVTVYSGQDDLEVVGESNYQGELWQIVGGRTNDRIRADIQAVLCPEPDNPYDPNAISVWISGMKVGYLARADAADYLPGLLALQERERSWIALSGVIVGGGIRDHGLGFLGVWLDHNPADFGLTPVTPPPPVGLLGELRTGLSQAHATDEDDDTYDLSWLERLPDDHIRAIKRLRELLQEDPDPIDRHYMFSELEWRLYRSRDSFASALDEYDEACRQHDAEMDGIRDALLAKFGKVPLLETYTQMAIRQQKAKNWAEALRWAERGLALYGDQAARPEAVEDLRKRTASYSAKLAGKPAPPAAASGRHGGAAAPATEVLRCRTCGKDFQRTVARGRKPTQCADCRTASS